MFISYYNNYSPVGDILVFSACIVFFILIDIAYISKTKNFILFRNILLLLCVSSALDIIFYTTLAYSDIFPHGIIYAARALYHFGLLFSLELYMLYIREVLQLDNSSWKLYHTMGRIGLAVIIVYEVIEPFIEAGFHIDANGDVYSGFNIFPFGYLYYIALIITMIAFNNGRIYRQIIYGVGGTMAVSFLIMLLQGVFHQTSFTAATFLFPAFALLYLLHSNPYDFETGSVNATSFEDSITYSYEHGKELFLMTLYVHDFDVSTDPLPEEINETVRKFVSSFFNKAVLFQITPGHLILSIETAKNPDYKDLLEKMIALFYEEYPKYQRDYKIVFTKTYDEISAKNDYLSLLRYVRNRMSENTIHEISPEDIEAFRQHEYILSELADIGRKNDMNDERVLVFCQPVYNLLTEKYDTAEALMRLKLPETGMVFPDRFIPMAEKYNYIQTLSMIILSKTCKQIKALMDMGYKVTRVSVNFSAIDIRDLNFCANVDKIIQHHEIPHDKIAIEITESQSEKDFLVMKEKVMELQKTGIKFYLDDFGTGYSNYERILELPFDIIKFDRSLTIASGGDLKSETMVSYLAHLFSDMGYAVLYEGVEDDGDEERCSRMCAKYLQGYKYSRPIPIEQLTDFFERAAAV